MPSYEESLDKPKHKQIPTMKFKITPLAAALALATSAANAATSLSATFTGALDSGLAQTYSGSGSLTVGGVTAVTTGHTYVGTTASDYAVSTDNWTATIEVQGSGNRYFGLGTGVSTGQGDPGWGTPQGLAGQAAAYTMLYSESFVDGGNGQIRSVQTQRKLSSAGYWTGETNYSDNDFDTIVGTTDGISDSAFYRYTMAYDYAAQTLTFDVVQISAFGGTVTSSGAGNFGVMSLDGMGYTASTGKIFFGGEGTFDNLSVTVVPEPSTALLGGLGLLALLRRRR
jgi:hypothetical protein